MMRRGWFAKKIVRSWYVFTDSNFNSPYIGLFLSQIPVHADPFTALVEADAWYREHVEKE